jgi:long-subunit acyl-CoA synthetase (AMP-forming)
MSLKLQHSFFEKAVYSKLREAIGLDQTVLGLTGAAPIAKELLGTWLGFGVEISEAFGMTESHAVLAFTPPEETAATLSTAGFTPGTSVRSPTRATSRSSAARRRSSSPRPARTCPRTTSSCPGSSR